MKNVKVFVSHVNVLQSMFSVEEDFNNRVGKMTCSVNIS